VAVLEYLKIHLQSYHRLDPITCNQKCCFSMADQTPGKSAAIFRIAYPCISSPMEKHHVSWVHKILAHSCTLTQILANECIAVADASH